MADLTAYTDSELNDLALSVNAERAKRGAAQRMSELLADYAQAGGDPLVLADKAAQVAADINAATAAGDTGEPESTEFTA